MFKRFIEFLEHILRRTGERLSESDAGNRRFEATAPGDEVDSERVTDPFDGEAVEIPIEDTIDLHTFDPSETRTVLEAYLEAAHAAGFREVRIIHGKGVYTQKRIVASYLSSHPDVLAFGDAPSESGGSGATIAQLRGSRDAV